MNKFAMAAIATSFLSIAGCGQEVPAEELRTVEWYKANKPDRDARLEKCQSNPGEMASTYNCVNANRAKNASTWGATGSGISPVGPIVVHELSKK